jgi:hypothetical protein
MAVITVFTFTSDTETVTRTKLNSLAANLLTEFNGNINNANIKAGAAIAYSKLNLATSIVKGDLGTSVAMSYTTSFTDGDLTAGVLTVTHSLGRQFVNPTIYDNSNIKIEPDTYTATDTNTLTVNLSAFGTLTGTWNIRIDA